MLTNILIASDFYNEYELYQTDDESALIEYLTALYKDPNTEKELPDGTEILGSQDDYFLDDVLSITDKTIWLSDLMEV